MKTLFAGSEKMQIPNIPIALKRMGHEVILYDKSMEYVEEHEEEYEAFAAFLERTAPRLVISTVFFQIVAAYTHKLGIPYAVYGMDSPHYAAWTPHYPMLDNVWLFTFDTKELERFQSCGYRNVFYMPLAAGTGWADGIQMTAAEWERYGCDISFVGGLYGSNAYDQCCGELPENLRQYLGGVLEQSAFIWDGQDRLTPALNGQIVGLCRTAAPRLCNYGFRMPDEYYFRQWTLARKLSQIERRLLLEQIAGQYDFRLYTRAEEQVPPGIRKYPQVNAMTDQLKVFSASRINLNITLRSIESGVPLRIFDIMSRAGFALTDYRPDAAGLFEEDQEIVMFRSPEELLDKLDYYLTHEEERRRIGENAYRKVRENYSYENQLGKIIQILGLKS